MSVKPEERIGGWLLGPLAWLLLALISTSLGLLLFANAILTPQTFAALRAQDALWFLSCAIAVAMWYYTLWLSIAFFKRRRIVPKHYILWLLISVLLALKTFAFSQVPDQFALRQLIFPLLAAAAIVPYLKRSERVKRTFVNP
ncbi:uncharacterized protein DUF2569 [Enterobacter sp. BIGb0383]|uniref:DUF2569 domain-containing protein n=1 Tax=unclassified Enterobacter TaxID=2608935 RepID=UPI000F4893EA|nr:MULTISPECIES: DUF2569 domain-containing protein [unclassified Enterobacter]ROP61965.1 uncharacterized protein DUF2569 [Enterobacter sp. BIGb0383]ROS12126.1 uncharacterized protein DUF2569 [Enterobacter sp. BIGb0359]